MQPRVTTAPLVKYCPACAFENPSSTSPHRLKTLVIEERSQPEASGGRDDALSSVLETPAPADSVGDKETGDGQSPLAARNRVEIVRLELEEAQLRVQVARARAEERVWWRASCRRVT